MSPIRPTLLTCTFHTQAAAATAQVRRGKWGSRLFDTGKAGGGSVFPSPQRSWVSTKTRQLFSFPRCFFLLCHWAASQGHSLPLLLRGAEQKAYQLYPSNSFHLHSHFSLKKNKRVASEIIVIVTRFKIPVFLCCIAFQACLLHTNNIWRTLSRFQLITPYNVRHCTLNRFTENYGTWGEANQQGEKKKPLKIGFKSWLWTERKT